MAAERSSLELERTLRHAQATRRTETDSWLNAYQDDVAALLAENAVLQRRVDELTKELQEKQLLGGDAVASSGGGS